MVLAPPRYLNRCRSYYFLNIDMSWFFKNINHDDVRHHDSTVRYIFYDGELVKHKIKYVVSWQGIKLTNLQCNSFEAVN